MTRPKLKSRKIQTSVTLSARDAALLRSIGEGNLSAGITEVLRTYNLINGIQDDPRLDGIEAAKKLNQLEKKKLSKDPIFE